MNAVEILDADTGPRLASAAILFRTYADEFAALIGEGLRRQGFDAELAALPGRYARPTGSLLLAIVRHRPVGCVALRDIGDGVCEMKRLFVVRDARGTGAGSTLIRAIVDRARSLDYRRMVLDSHPELADAVRAYRRAGFVDVQAYAGDSDPHLVYLGMDLISPSSPVPQ